MSGLEQQQDSLRVLHLAPKDDNCRDEPDLTHARVDSFHRLHALENLSTSFRVLLGTLPMNYTDEGNWKYPPMRDILPHGLQELFLSTTATMVSHNYHDGYSDLFSSALPLQANGLYLKKIRVAYSDMIPGAHSLPFNFWDIKKSYVAHGVKFDYSISISADRDEPGLSLADAHISDMVSMLKSYGPKAVEMAHHFSCFGSQIVQKLLSELGYPTDWISSEAGRKYMFVS
ncbi:hypothetical protein J4E85_006956 [Alternaria conjuncta]|uniref:uncharacterized protein n=1 Tax=Alternaria conjuncta TaxID=181017 RepID=UPI00221F2309|nr:uncharacterized protein J4E85_006956 [Alternaria conjuncta]KAI4926662.1 hypothetical protein J4E85_006956 [Alternaria conjuncta]